MDVQRVLYNLHRKRVPTEVLREKAKEYVETNLLSRDKAENMMRVIEQERDSLRTVNEVGSDEERAERGGDVSRRLSMAEMAKELEKREREREREDLMKKGSSDVTDQWRVYAHIINSLLLGSPFD